MENTLNLLLQDTQAKWYAVGNGSPVGPLSSKEIVLRLQSGALSFASHLWREGLNTWTRIYDLAEYKCLLPAEPAQDLILGLQKVAVRAQPNPPPVQQQGQSRVWFAYVDNTQYGPFALAEVLTLVESKRVTASTYVWKKGFSEWQLAETVAEFSSVFNKAAVPEKTDKRNAPRKPFEARIILTDGKEVGWAVCRDISVGGMQVLMDHQPGPVGTVLKINVNTTSEVPNFACEGVVVRILEDNRGFSCRFVNMPADAKTAIEKYIQ
jgi:hypothetical protein